MAQEPTWEVATDAGAVHALLQASDAHHAAVYGLPVPARNPATTRRLVDAGAVQVLSYGTELAAMFTLTTEPPFAQDISIFPGARRPMYLQRLAVTPQRLARSPLLGLRCLRRAGQLALALGADALRAEANPDLAATAQLMAVSGFVRCGPVQTSARLRRVYLQKDLIRW